MIDPVHHLVGPQEIAHMLGVSRQRVTQFTTDPKYNFPAPTVILAAGKVWHTEEVEAWAEARGRKVNPR